MLWAISRRILRAGLLLRVLVSDIHESNRSQSEAKFIFVLENLVVNSSLGILTLLFCQGQNMVDMAHFYHPMKGLQPFGLIQRHRRKATTHQDLLKV